MDNENKTLKLEADRAAQAARIIKRENIKSPDFYAYADPSEASLMADYRQRQAEKEAEALKTNLKRQRWYGAPADDEGNIVNTYKGAREEDAIIKIVNALGAPLFGMVGATGHALGYGKGSTLGESVMTSVSEREVFGQLLKRMGVNKNVAAVAGFGLDVALDPVNLLFAGGGQIARRSLLGKVVEGGAKKGAKGMEAALSAWGSRKAYQALSLMPGSGMNTFLKRTAAKVIEQGVDPFSSEGINILTTAIAGAENGSRYQKLFANVRMRRAKLGEIASKKAREFNELVNWDINKIIDKRALRTPAFSKLKEMGQGHKVFDRIYETFAYSNSDYYEKIRLIKDLEEFMKEAGTYLSAQTKGLNTIEEFEMFLKKFVNEVDMSDVQKARLGNLRKQLDKIDNFQSLNSVNSEILTAPEKRRYLGELMAKGTDMAGMDKPIIDLHGGYTEALANNIQAAMDSVADEVFSARHIAEAMFKAAGSSDQLTIRKINDKILSAFKIQDTTTAKVVAQITNLYEKYIGLFKTAKISSLNPATMLNAIVGNPTFSLMAGLNPFGRNAFERMRDSLALVSPKVRATKAGLKRAADVQRRLMADPMYLNFFDKYGSEFKDVVGVDFKKAVTDDLENFLANDIGDLFSARRASLKTWESLSEAERGRLLHTWEYNMNVNDIKKMVFKANKGKLGKGEDLSVKLKELIGKEKPTLSDIMDPSFKKEFIDRKKKAYLDYSKAKKLPSMGDADLVREATLVANSDYDSLVGFLSKKIGSDWKGPGLYSLPEGTQSILYQELRGLKGFRETVEKMDKWATDPSSSFVQKTTGKMFNFARRRSEDFQMIDQVYKLKDWLKMTLDGVSEKELLKLTNNFMISSSNIPSHHIVGRYMMNGIEYFRISPEKAMEIVSEIYMNYAAMPAFIQVIRNMPIFSSPFFAFCRSEDTQILTRTGFKNHSNLKVGDEALSLNQKTKEFEWKKVTKVFRFNIDEDAYVIENDDVDVICTAGHDLLVANETFKRASNDSYWSIKKKKASLAYDDISFNLVCGAEKGFADELGEDYYEDDYLVAVADSVKKKKKSRKIKNKTVSISDFNTEMLSSLSKRQLLLLFFLITGKHVNNIKDSFKFRIKSHRQEILDTFQVLAVFIGLSVSFKKGLWGRKYVVVSKNVYKKVRSSHFRKEAFKGVVWCPEVEDNHNWVARRNGKIDITGNSYAMMQKTGKTFLNNPGAFNKVNFFLKELEPELSPAQREAMKSKYSRWLGETGQLYLGKNVPFFKNQGLFINLASMIPYYSLDMINESDRDLMEGVRGKAAEIIDRSPLFKDPVGQIFLDYILVPWIIQDQGKNMWGGPLYEKDASGLRKLAYVGRQIGDSIVPSAVGSALGLGLSAVGASDELMNMAPISYQGRKVGFGVQGKSAIGIPASEDAASRGLRSVLSTVGINLYPLYENSIINEIQSRAKR